MKSGFLVGTKKNRKIYVFSNDKFIFSNETKDQKIINKHWGIVRNNIVDSNKIDAAYAAPSGKTYLFSSDQYVRYSTNNITFVDEGYPKKLENWINEENITLPTQFYNGINAAFTDNDGKTYFFTKNQFISFIAKKFLYFSLFRIGIK